MAARESGDGDDAKGHTELNEVLLMRTRHRLVDSCEPAARSAILWASLATRLIIPRPTADLASATRWSRGLEAIKGDEMSYEYGWAYGIPNWGDYKLEKSSMLTTIYRLIVHNRVFLWEALRHSFQQDIATLSRCGRHTLEHSVIP